MACSTSVTLTSYEEPIPSTRRSATNADIGPGRLRQRRRHSSYHTQPWTFEQDNIQLLVDTFLSELNRRLEFLETYGQLKLEDGIERAYSTLQAVRDSCNQISDDVIGAGRRRAQLLVDTIDSRYKGALARKETMEQKVQEGVRVMESLLADFETRAYAFRDSHMSAAHDFFDSSKKQFKTNVAHAKASVDDGLERARLAKQALKGKIERAIARARKYGLLTYEDLPAPWQVNPHILSGYRFNQSVMECFGSWFSISNEFFNIWSHGLGLVLVLAIAFYVYPSTHTFSLSTTSDILVAAVFFFAAAKCMICSTMWHTMSSISSQSLMERFACVDYTGISFLVASSIMTTEYTAFYCEPVSRWIYMVLTLVLGIAGTILPWNPYFNRNDKSWLRVSFFVGLAATGAIPVFQLALTRGLAPTIFFYLPIAKSVAVYLGGAILYAMQIPECWWPGMFDYLGGSHNIWHIAVLGGILFHYVAMQEFFKYAFERAALDASCSSYY